MKRVKNLFLSAVAVSVIALPFSARAGVESFTYKVDMPRPVVRGNGLGADTLREAIDSFDSKDYGSAYRLFKEALQEIPDDKELERYFANVLAVMGFKEYEDLNFVRATELFSEATDLYEDVSFYKGLAMSQLKLDDMDGAIDTLLPYKDDAQVSAILVDIYSTQGNKFYSEGDLEEALASFLEGLDVEPDNGYLIKRIATVKEQYNVEGEFHSKEGSHFTVKYQSGENAVAGHLVSLLLEEAYLRVGYDFGYFPEDTIVAVLYARKQFHDITRSPSWSGAIYDGRIKLPVGGVTEKTDLLEGVLFHEYTHAVIHRVSKGRAPVWLNEGMAQYVEGKRVSSADKKALKAMLGKGGFVLRNIEGSFMGLNSSQARGAYLMSLSATEYIINDFGSFSAMGIMERLGKGDSLGEAISATLFLSYSELNDSWLRYVNR